MEENNSMDTPQPQTANTGTTTDAFGAPATVEGSNNDNLSVEDAFFSRAEEEGSQAPDNTGQPDVVEQPADNKNDTCLVVVALPGPKSTEFASSTFELSLYSVTWN